MNDSNDDSVSIVDEKKQMEEFLQVRDYFSQCDPNQIVSFSQIGNIKLDEQFEQSAIVTLTNKILSIAMEEKFDRLMMINGVDCYSVLECTNNLQNKTYTPKVLKNLINCDYKFIETIFKRIQIMAQMNVFHKNKHCHGRLLINPKTPKPQNPKTPEVIFSIEIMIIQSIISTCTYTTKCQNSRMMCPLLYLQTRFFPLLVMKNSSSTQNTYNYLIDIQLHSHVFDYS